MVAVVLLDVAAIAVYVLIAGLSDVTKLASVGFRSDSKGGGQHNSDINHVCHHDGISAAAHCKFKVTSIVSY